MSGKLSRSDIEQALNCEGLSSRSYVTDSDGLIGLGIQVPLSLNEGVEISRRTIVNPDLYILRDNIRTIAWRQENGSHMLVLAGGCVTVSIGNGITLPEGHDVSSSRHWPFVYQGNDGDRAERIHDACVSGLGFDFCSMAALFSYTNSAAIAELLRRGPGHEIIRVNDQETYADLLPHLSKAFPWRTGDRLPLPLRSVDGWVARPILQEG